jgi:hypothetical protein
MPPDDQDRGDGSALPLREALFLITHSLGINLAWIAVCRAIIVASLPH